MSNYSRPLTPLPPLFYCHFEAAEARRSGLVAEVDGNSTIAILIDVGKTSSDTLNRWISPGALDKQC